MGHTVTIATACAVLPTLYKNGILTDQKTINDKTW